MSLNASFIIYFYNGIIYVDDRNQNECFLINPANKDYHNVPHSTIHDRFLMYGIGLGFDVRDSDFKVLRYGNRADMKKVVEITG